MSKKNLSNATSWGDLIFGNTGNDHLAGAVGHYGLIGYAGNDKLVGSSGRDLLFGGPGNDKLEGGEGDDIYLIRVGTGLDHIKGFDSGDRIDISDFGFESFQAVLDAAQEADDGVLIDLGNHDRLLIQNVSFGDLHAEQFIISSAITGPSSSSSPYVISTNANVV